MLGGGGCSFILFCFFSFFPKRDGNGDMTLIMTIRCCAECAEFVACFCSHQSSEIDFGGAARRIRPGGNVRPTRRAAPETGRQQKQRQGRTATEAGPFERRKQQQQRRWCRVRDTAITNPPLRAIQHAHTYTAGPRLQNLARPCSHSTDQSSSSQPPAKKGSRRAPLKTLLHFTQKTDADIQNASHGSIAQKDIFQLKTHTGFLRCSACTPLRTPAPGACPRPTTPPARAARSGASPPAAGRTVSPGSLARPPVRPARPPGPALSQSSRGLGSSKHWHFVRCLRFVGQIPMYVRRVGRKTDDTSVVPRIIRGGVWGPPLPPFFPPKK